MNSPLNLVNYFMLSVKVESCQTPPDIEHGSIISPLFESNYPISYEVMYTCDPGYVTFPKLAPLTYRCEENGCWAPNTVLPSCNPESSLFYGKSRIKNYEFM